MLPKTNPARVVCLYKVVQKTLTYIAASYIICLSKPRTTQDPMLEDPVQDSLFHEASETAQGFEEENKQMQETFTWKPAVLGD